MLLFSSPVSTKLADSAYQMFLNFLNSGLLVAFAYHVPDSPLGHPHGFCSCCYQFIPFVFPSSNYFLNFIF